MHIVSAAPRLHCPVHARDRHRARGQMAAQLAPHGTFSLAHAHPSFPEIEADAASSSVTAALDLEVEKVNDFYMDRIEEAVIILHSLKQHAEQLVRWLSNRRLDVLHARSLPPPSARKARVIQADLRPRGVAGACWLAA